MQLPSVLETKFSGLEMITFKHFPYLSKHFWVSTYQNISESVLSLLACPHPSFRNMLRFTIDMFKVFFFKFNLIYYFHRFPLHIFSRLVHFYPSFGNKLKYNRATCVQFNKQSRNRKAELHDKYTNFLFIVICIAGKVIRHNTISCRC